MLKSCLNISKITFRSITYFSKMDIPPKAETEISKSLKKKMEKEALKQ